MKAEDYLFFFTPIESYILSFFFFFLNEKNRKFGLRPTRETLSCWYNGLDRKQHLQWLKICLEGSCESGTHRLWAKQPCPARQATARAERELEHRSSRRTEHHARQRRVERRLQWMLFTKFTLCFKGRWSHYPVCLHCAHCPGNY